MKKDAGGPSSATEQFEAMLLRLLDLPLMPPSVRLDKTGRRRVSAEFGDFRGHVPYSPGDDLRFLDWSVLARSGQKLLRQFDMREHDRLVLVLDLSRSMALRWPQLRRLVLLYVYLALHRLDALELICVGKDGVLVELASGPEAWPRLRAQVQSLQADGSQSFEGAAPHLEHLGRDGRKVLISDFQASATVLPALARLADMGQRMLCLFPRIALEEAGSKTLAIGYHDLQDPETASRLRVQMTPELLAAFHSEQEAWEGEMHIHCQELGHAFHAATLPSEDLASHVDSWLPFLQTRQRQRRWSG